MSDEPLDNLSLDSTKSASTELPNLFKDTKANNAKIRACIADIEQGDPHLSGSAASPAPDEGGGEMAQDE